MEKPSPSQRAKTRPSITSVLKVISDEKALAIFNDIVVSGNDNDRFIPLKEINLSSKEYHSRLSSFLKAGLIKRHKGKYIPTFLGRVVYDSLMVIEEALSHYWKLKVIDQIEMSSFDLPTKEVMTRLINALIDNHRIKDVLLKLADVAYVEDKSEEIFYEFRNP
jgi:DNA-binding HxlR family transcriptional regulator